MKLVTTTSVHLTPEERALMRERRRATGIPAKLFAHLAGCSWTSLYHYESGDRHPSLAAYTRLAETINREIEAMEGVLEDFEEFWKITPVARRVDKKRARAEYAKARKLATKDEIHAGYARYRNATAHLEPERTKHPATWLHGECWTDEAYQGNFVAAPIRRNAGDERIAAARAQLARDALDAESRTRH